MGIKRYKPVTPGLRFRTGYTFEEITAEEPEKSLVKGKKRISGRNNQGRMTVRGRGGAHKRLYRIIDFKRDKRGMWAKVVSIEYDPNRTCWIALLHYEDGEKRYIIAPEGLKVGDKVMSGEDAPIQVGNALPLAKIPVGMEIHNIELKPGRGGQLVRSAGTAAKLEAKEGKYAIVKLPSGEIRLINLNCYATIGRVSNADHENIVIGKAGRNRWKGWRPITRGMVMNPVDHPHGGGEGGKQKGYPYPMSPWGWHCKGKKTRRRKPSDKYILQRRKK